MSCDSNIKYKFSFNDCKTTDCKVLAESADKCLATFNKDGGLLAFDNLNIQEWKSAKYLVFDIKSRIQTSCAIFLEFWQSDNISDEANMFITIGILPQFKTRLSFPLAALDSQNLFLDRTPGKLKTVVKGKKIDIDMLSKFAISVLPANEDITFEIEGLHIACEEPDYPLPQIKLVDELGQNMSKNWTGKTENAEQLVDYLLSEYKKQTTPLCDDRSNYGGWKNKQFDATGYFRTQYDSESKRWWLCDPDGYVFFSTGLDCVRPSVEGRIDGIESLYEWLPERDGKFRHAYSLSKHDRFSGDFYDFAVSNLIRAFGENWFDSWAAITKRRMLEWGFNTIANWSDERFMSKAEIPFVLEPSSFPGTTKYIFRDFPDVFSPEYLDNANICAKEMEYLKDNKFLIGYFLRNEPHWAFIDDLNIAEELLDTDYMFSSKYELIKFISEKYINIQDFNIAWKTNLSSFTELAAPIKKAASLSVAASNDLAEFSVKMIERYVGVPSQAMKNVLPNHLNLGMRYAWVGNKNVIAGCNNFDIFSFNCYNTDAVDEIRKNAELVNMPLIIGEFHSGALDRGLSATGIGAVTTQKERGNAYRYYVERSAAEPYCVGTHYFTLNDQPHLGRFDGENYQIGVVDICNREYDEFVAGIKTAHSNIYKVAKGTIGAYDKYPNVIRKIFF